MVQSVESLLRVPAPNGVPPHLRIEHDATFQIVAVHRRLGHFLPSAQQLEVVPVIRSGSRRLVPQNLRANRELVQRGHGVEHDHPVPSGCRRLGAKGYRENSVAPLVPLAGDIEITVQRFNVEVGVHKGPHSVLRQTEHVQAGVEEVRNVGESGLAVSWLHVDGETGQTDSGRHNGRGNFETMHFPSRVEVNYPHGRLLHLQSIAVFQKAGVNEPETVAGVIDTWAIN